MSDEYEYESTITIRKIGPNEPTSCVKCLNYNRERRFPGPGEKVDAIYAVRIGPYSGATVINLCGRCLEELCQKGRDILLEAQANQAADTEQLFQIGTEVVLNVDYSVECPPIGTKGEVFYFCEDEGFVIVKWETGKYQVISREYREAIGISSQGGAT